MANRTVKFYKHYFKEFFAAQTPQVRKKIAQTLVWVQEGAAERNRQSRKADE